MNPISQAIETELKLPALRDAAHGHGLRIAQIEDRLETINPGASMAAGMPGFRTVTKYADFLKPGPWLVNSPVAMEGSLTLDKPVWFGPGGALLQRPGEVLVFNGRPINPCEHQVFFGWSVNESYPDRWTFNAGASVVGTFGGLIQRPATWWGLVTSDAIGLAPEDEAGANVSAIHAAALSRPFLGGEASPVDVQLPGGRIAINRPIRLDGLRAGLVGASAHGITATRLWCASNRWRFNEGYTIRTDDFPDGTVPVVVLGYERQPQGNPDEGFQGAVRNLSIVCPLSNSRPVSGVMWECGLQEVSNIRNVAISNYSGMAIGGPRRQHLKHNDDNPRDTFPQVNTVVFEGIWATSPNKRFHDPRGAVLFGLNWELRNSTFHHHTAGGRFRRAVIACGSRSMGRIQNVHVEHNPPANNREASACVEVSDNRAAGRMSFEGLYGHLAGNLADGKRSVTLRNLNPRASFHAANINHRTGVPKGHIWENLTQCVEDVPLQIPAGVGVKRGFQCGTQFAHASGKVCARYAREHDHYASQTRVDTLSELKPI
jgi:hypothetical protein